MSGEITLTEKEKAAIAVLKAALENLPETLHISVDESDGLVEVYRRTSDYSAICLKKFHCLRAFSISA